MKVRNEVKEMAIRYHLKAMLADKGITQKELAEVTKIRAPTISAICVGSVKQLPIGVLDKICTVLDCQPGNLLEYVPDEIPNAETRAAIEELDNGGGEHFTGSTEELFKKILSEPDEATGE